MDKKVILLTGGSGFIGKNIAESPLSKEFQIITPSSKELNLVDEQCVRSFFSHNDVNYVIHCGAKPSHRNAKDLNNIYYTNSRMFFNLERECNKYEKMLVIGSGSIYDCRYYHSKMKEFEWKEHIPADELGFCKYVCEKVIEQSSNIYDLRVFGVFGKYEDFSIRFISNAICKTLFDLPISIKQNRVFDYIYIDDLIPILGWFLNNEPKYKSYNITPEQSISLYELALMVNDISKKKLPIHILKDGYGLEYTGDNKLIKEEMADNYSFSPLYSSVEKLYRWYKENITLIDKQNLLFDK